MGRPFAGGCRIQEKTADFGIRKQLCRTIQGIYSEPPGKIRTDYPIPEVIERIFGGEWNFNGGRSVGCYTEDADRGLGKYCGSGDTSGRSFEGGSDGYPFQGVVFRCGLPDDGACRTPESDGRQTGVQRGKRLATSRIYSFPASGRTG